MSEGNKKNRAEADVVMPSTGDPTAAENVILAPESS
jgi:hypothetical protein